MIFANILREAWVSIGASRLRTFLAMLGIMIGVGSVVLLVAVGSGSKKAVQDAINKLGSNMLIVSANSIQDNSVSLDLKDAEAIELLPYVVGAAPYSRPSSVHITYGKAQFDSNAIGTTPSYFLVHNWSFSEGESFSEEDVQLAKRRVVIGASIAQKLFAEEIAQGGNIAGATIYIQNTPYTIAGVLNIKGASLDGRDQDNSVYVPCTTAQSRLSEGYDIGSNILLIYVQADSEDDMEEVTENVKELLLKRHRHAKDYDDFSVRSMQFIMQAATDSTASLSLLLTAIASISLIVGGIGIMNIMLVTVAERTREIGIRKAIGATFNNILLQFLLEAIMITCIGSMTGLLIGFACGLAAQKWFLVPVLFSLWSVVFALAVALGVGVISGIYPAWKAAKLVPIEALRSVGV